MMRVEKPDKRRIIWLDADRFDTKPNKSPWIEMSKVLQAHGFDVTLVTGYEKAPYENEHLDVVSLRVWDIPFIFRIALLIRMLSWVVRNASRDDIIILKPESLLIAPSLKRRGFHKLHLDVRTLPLRALSSFKGKVDHWVFWTFTIGQLRKYASSYSFITERLKSAIEQEFRAVFDDYVIWQSSVNMSVFRSVEAPGRGISRELFTVFYHGSIYGTRGIDKVIEAMSLLSPAYRGHIRFVIVGPDSGKIALQDIVRRHGVADSVTLVGYVPYEDIPNRIAQADCCICPLPDLLEWNVSSPLKVFEYMACEKPVILTPIPAHKDVADGKDFVVWTKGCEASDIREAIEYAFDHRSQLADAARAARDFMRDTYDWTTQGRHFADYLGGRYLREPS